jgi:ABC-type glycerol-3-phosphate transport system substrate-binding protein
MSSGKKTRRQFLETAALATAGVAAAPFVRTSHAAGKLSLGLWDHWVPTANEPFRRLIEEWGQKNNVEVTVDFITSVGDKDILTAAAEARARTGHDILSLRSWQVTVHRNLLEPIDDVVKALTDKYGPYVENAEYLCKHDGRWRAIPSPTGSHTYPMSSRLDLFKQHAGIDLKEIFPASPQRDKAKVDAWTYDAFLQAAKKLHAAGHAFGNPIGQTSDSPDWLGPLFLSFGSIMVDAKGNIAVNSDGTRAALEYMKQLTQYMPPEVYAWDDAGNNRWYISGKGSCIQNPPSHWAVAKRDAPQVAAQTWFHDTPRGPKGRFRGVEPFLLGVWSFSPNKSAAKDLILHLSQKENVSKILRASQGYDLPLLPSFYDHPVWQEEGPPAGAIYNYPTRGDEQVVIGGYPAPPRIAANIYTQSLHSNLVAKATQAGQSIKDAIAWAENELEGYIRG